jgi:leucyl-tRNA synthetase
VDPDAIFQEYGADTARFFILSDSPPQADFDWKDSGVEGCYKFLSRVWRVVIENRSALSLRFDLPAYDQMSPAQRELYQLTNRTIAGISQDIQTEFQFNTVISKIREFVNYLSKLPVATTADPLLSHAIVALLKLLAPIAPHLTEELWTKLGGEGSVHDQAWPDFDPQALVADSVEIVVQVNGKVRDRFQAATGLAKEELERQALASPKLVPYLEGKAVAKVIVVPDKLVNIVVK